MQYKKWAEQWLACYVRPATRERTYEKYAHQMEKHILPVLGELALEKISAGRLQAFTAGLTERGYKANTVRGILAVVKASLKRAVSLGVTHVQFADAIVCPKADERRIRCFTTAEQKRLETYVLHKGRPEWIGIVLCLYTGLRIGELLALEWRDIDFGSGAMHVTKSCHDGWQNGRYIKQIDAPKTENAYRIVPMPKSLRPILKAMQKRSRCGYVVPGRTEQGAQIRSYQRTFANLLAKLGLPHRGFHALRHTFATRALEVGMDVRTLSEILGHAGPAVTLKRYAHSLLGHKTEMMNRVGKLLQSRG